MAIISLDGVDMPAPTKYKLPLYDLDSKDSKRNEEGYFQRDRVRDGIFKIGLEFKVYSSDAALIKTAIAPEKVKAKFITEAGYVTKDLYVGDRDIEMISFDRDYNNILWSISFNLTEY